MSLSLAASADGLSLDLKLGSTVIGTFSINGIEAGVLIASAAEAQALTNTKKIITPDMLAKAFQGANQSLAGSGYQKLPGGLIIQWGVTTTITAGTASAITWPITFPNLCMVCSPANPGTGTTASQYVAQSVVPSQTGTTFVMNTSSGIIRYIAIGY